MINIPLLKEICETPGAPGYEKKIRDLIVEKISDYVDEVSVDNLGNIIALKKSTRNPGNKKSVGCGPYG